MTNIPKQIIEGLGHIRNHLQDIQDYLETLNVESKEYQIIQEQTDNILVRFISLHEIIKCYKKIYH